MKRAPHDDERLLAHIRRELEAGADDLDELTRARLGAARRRAVDAARPAGGPLGEVLAVARHLPAWGLAALAALTLLAFLLWRPAAPPPEPLTLLEDLELLGAAEDPEFYRDLDFYLWLDDVAQRS